MKRRFAILLCCLLLFLSVPAFAIDVEGSWYGSVKIAGVKANISVYMSGGSFSASGGGYSLSGSYSVSGKKVHMSASSASASLRFSDNGKRQKLSGSGTMRGMAWSMSLSRDTPEDVTKQDSASKSKKSVLTEKAIYAEYEGMLGEQAILARLYSDGYLFWSETVAGEQPGTFVTRVCAAGITFETDTAQEQSLTGTLDITLFAPGQSDFLIASEEAEDVTNASEDAQEETVVLEDTAQIISLALRLDEEETGDTLTLTNAAGEDVTLVRADVKLEAIPSEEIMLPFLTLEKGDAGDAVVHLQEALIARDILDGAADGKFGKMTKAAVALFEEAQGLSADGIADPDVMTALFGGVLP